MTAVAKAMARAEGGGEAVVWARREVIVASREVIRDWRASRRSWALDILKADERGQEGRKPAPCGIGLF